jgi:DNA/RNA-binding protein KIN17
MPKHEESTAAFLNQQQRKSQKTKIRWYCGLCHVACKDENGYKCHLEHETHIHREQAVQESLRSFQLTSEDRKFRKRFLEFLATKHFGQTVLAHDIYRELYPLDRGHNIMKSTAWETLGVFVAQLRKEGRLEAHKGLKGWQMRVTSEEFVDSEPDTQKPPPQPLKEKRKDEIEEISLKRVKPLDQIESHTASTARVSGEKVSFSLGALKSASRPAVSSAFGADSSSDEH